jgi:hypothetical protein
MTTVNVQFSDSSEGAVVAYFAGPQNASIYENCGTVDVAEARWKSFYQAQSPFVQAVLPNPQ